MLRKGHEVGWVGSVGMWLEGRFLWDEQNKIPLPLPFLSGLGFYQISFYPLFLHSLSFSRAAEI